MCIAEVTGGKVKLWELNKVRSFRHVSLLSGSAPCWVAVTRSGCINKIELDI